MDLLLFRRLHLSTGTLQADAEPYPRYRFFRWRGELLAVEAPLSRVFFENRLSAKLSLPINSFDEISHETDRPTNVLVCLVCVIAYALFCRCLCLLLIVLSPFKKNY